ncbi:28611_t:CDS:1, partial [Racocetra persica]
DKAEVDKTEVDVNVEANNLTSLSSSWPDEKLNSLSELSIMNLLQYITKE